ncbi:arsenic resistance N-acetyltransferase ArsN2 [Larkinella soli]|uniref:arsenic resistance N-acetyltransferase ArsN2 n=1 Tax=Larkinella soli TaxID=1770527 RepID=UPI000FFBDA79|nr:arsenic resistance N-acetyltransferase ArsN2 [Larkinella soli]
MAILLLPARPEHYASVVGLLSSAALPTEDLPADLQGFILAFDGERLVGSAGLADEEGYGLLRSVAVDPGYRNRRLGRQLAEAALDLARQRSVREVYLITTTADRYFERHGFRPVGREEVPDPIARTRQFGEICPASAVIMKKDLV